MLNDIPEFIERINARDASKRVLGKEKGIHVVVVDKNIDSKPDQR